MASTSNNDRDDAAPRGAAAVANRTAGASSSAATSGFSAPAGHGLRRSRTVADASPSARRLSGSPMSTRRSFEAPPRRSSNFSDYSLGEARDLLNPKPTGVEIPHPESSSLASLSLAFALLPALAGSLFKNGSAVVTDIMLLGLSAVFLNWSVTQPWSWYHSAQEIRVREQASTEMAIEEDEEEEEESVYEAAQESPRDPNSSLDDVPEEDDDADESRAAPAKKKIAHSSIPAKRQAALNELYLHEILALFSCFVLPLLGAYLLHAIRSQLSRPSEGLVSNYNLTIFLLVSELRVFSHMIKLVQSRTLHLHRIVHANPFTTSSSSSDGNSNIQDLRDRLDRLESRNSAVVGESESQKQAPSDSERAKQEALMARDVRNAIQPELDALNRAVRRYEKKATLLQHQTESRFLAVDARLDDAIALAAAAAKNSNAQKNSLLKALEFMGAIVLFPLTTVMQILLLPFTALLGLVNRSSNNQNASHPRASRPGRPGKTHGQSRYSGDRMPSRVTKR